MIFLLTGPNQGKTGNWGGFRFRQGATEIPDDAKEAAVLLRRYYAAHPIHLVEKGPDGKFVVKEEQEEVAGLSLDDILRERAYHESMQRRESGQTGGAPLITMPLPDATVTGQAGGPSVPAGGQVPPGAMSLGDGNELDEAGGVGNGKKSTKTAK